MSSPNFQTFHEESMHFGEFHDWTSAKNPVSGSFGGVTLNQQGQNFSTNHKRDRDGVYRTGGIWTMVKTERRYAPSGNVISYRPGWYPAYKGAYRASVLTWPNDLQAFIGYSFSLESLASDALYNGARAWAAMRPDMPSFNSAQSLMEMKDFVPEIYEGLRRLILKIEREEERIFHKYHRRVSKRWLAMKFGWEPLFMDIKNQINAFHGKKKRLEQLIRDNGKPVRRRVQISNQDTNAGSGTTYPVAAGSYQHHPKMYPSHVSQVYPSYLRCYNTWNNTFTRKTWAAGQFRYLLPPGPRDDGWKKKMYARILGTNSASFISPQTVYNLIPWSWLGDYFTDLGRFIDAITPGVADRLICDYAYVMQSREANCTYTVHEYTYSNHAGNMAVEAIAENNGRTITKTRVAASPFGFGLSQDNLTPNQIGTLGYLGMSRI